MPKKRVFLHARRRVAKEFQSGDLERFLAAAVAEAECQPNWAPGEEYWYSIDEVPYAIEGLTSSALNVCHEGTRYAVYYYDGIAGETYT
jgi:hypothetical protein